MFIYTLDNGLTCYTQMKNKIRCEFIVWFLLFLGIGISACVFYGGRAADCGLSDFPITKVPDTCLSIFFDGVTVDLKYHVGLPCGCSSNFDRLGSIT
jgi:hypothetical protein